MKPLTVSQEIYKRVREEFAKGTQRISKSAFLEWTVTYQDAGKTKTANKDTMGRKMRLLIESNFLGRETENGQTYIVPAKGVPHQVIKDTYEPEVGEPEPYYPMLIERNGEKVVRIVRSMQERDALMDGGAFAL